MNTPVFVDRHLPAITIEAQFLFPFKSFLIAVAQDHLDECPIGHVPLTLARPLIAPFVFT